MLSGLRAALASGHVSLFCELLTASSLARSAAHRHGARSKNLLAMAFAGQSDQAFEAVVSCSPSPPTDHYLEAILETYGSMSRERRDKVAPPGSNVLSMALWHGLDGDRTIGEVEEIIACAPASSAPRLLDALSCCSGRARDLSQVMRLASSLRQKAAAVRPVSPPSMEEVLAQVRAVGDGPPRRDQLEVSVSRWVGWMVSFGSMAGDVPWYELHRHAMPEPERSVFWVALSAHMAGARSLRDVPVMERASILQAMVKDVLAFDGAPYDVAAPVGPDGSLPTRMGTMAPLNRFLIAWRAAEYPGLVEQATAAGSAGLVRRLMGFGASLDQVLADGTTLLQAIALNRYDYFSFPDTSRYSRENCRANWGVVTAEGESILHLLFRKDPPPTALEAVQDLSIALGLLSRFFPFLPSSVHSMADASGKTPWGCLQDYMSRIGDNEKAIATFSSWARTNADIVSALEAGCFQHAMPPSAPPARPRPRM